MRKEVGRMGSVGPVIWGPSARAGSQPTAEMMVERVWSVILEVAPLLLGGTLPQVSYQSSWDASRAPSTMAASLAQAMLVSTFRPQAEVPKPQSLPAMTFSRPTMLA